MVTMLQHIQDDIEYAERQRAKRHSLRRTSPKGGPFIGTCRQCGQEGLTTKQAMGTECPNQRGLTQDEAVIEAIEG